MIRDMALTTDKKRTVQTAHNKTQELSSSEKLSSSEVNSIFGQEGNPEALFDLLTTRTCGSSKFPLTSDWDVFSSVAEVFGLQSEMTSPSTPSESSHSQSTTSTFNRSAAKVINVYPMGQNGLAKKETTSHPNNTRPDFNHKPNGTSSTPSKEHRQRKTSAASLHTHVQSTSPQSKPMKQRRTSGPPSFRTAIARRNSQPPPTDPPPPPPQQDTSTIFEALRLGDASIVKEFIKTHMTDELRNFKDSAGNTILHAAVDGGNLECVKKMKDFNLSAIENKSKLTPVLLSIQNGNVEILEWFLSNCPNLPFSGSNKQSLLHYAAKNGQDACLRLLLESNRFKASEIERDHNGNTPAHVAALHGHLQCLQSLVEYQVDVTTLNNKGHTPCFYADFNSHNQCVAYLMIVQICIDLAKSILQMKVDKGHNCGATDHDAWNIVNERIQQSSDQFIVFRTQRNVQKPALPPRGIAVRQSTRMRSPPTPPSPVLNGTDLNEMTSKEDNYAVIDDVISKEDIVSIESENDYLTPVSRSVNNIPPKRSSFQRLSFRRAVNKCKENESDEFQDTSNQLQERNKTWRKASWQEHKKQSRRHSNKPTPMKINLSHVDFKETYLRPVSSPPPMTDQSLDPSELSPHKAQKPRIVAIRTRSLSKDEGKSILKNAQNETHSRRMLTSSSQSEIKTDEQVSVV